MITVCIPSISTRFNYRERAVRSVYGQTLQASAIEIHVDYSGVGAARSRDIILSRVDTPWVAFLDDDDEMYPTHLEDLYSHAIDHEADLVYPWFDVAGGTDPFPQFFRKPWDDNEPHQTTVTFLARTEAIRAVGGFSNYTEDGTTDPLGNRAGEDYRLILRLIEKKYKISHLPKRTWRWHHHSNNTSGLAERIR